MSGIKGDFGGSGVGGDVGVGSGGSGVGGDVSVGSSGSGSDVGSGDVDRGRSGRFFATVFLDAKGKKKIGGFGNWI